jgi:Ca2+/H+ antiporter, TMEM165/GDT1 family
LEAFLVSLGIVGLAEIGDKTQLLSIVLAARFSRPMPVICGILVATLANHAIAGTLGSFFGHWLQGGVMRWLLALSFFGVAVWALIPDRHADATAGGERGAFAATLCAFFVAEIGDKTEIATAGLAARFTEIVPVVLGTTLGMLAANVPVVLLGQRFARRLPLRAIRLAAAAAFAAIGVWTLMH